MAYCCNPRPDSGTSKNHCRSFTRNLFAVYEQETDLISDVFLTQDGHAQERSLLDDFLDSVKPDDLWIADRNFGTPDFMIMINSRLANFAIRRHGALKGKLLGESKD